MVSERGSQRAFFGVSALLFAASVGLVAFSTREGALFSRVYFGEALVPAQAWFTLDETRGMTEAGADILVAHMGCTSGGSIGAHSVKTLDHCVQQIQEMVELAKGIRSDVLVLCHGGPIAEPADAQYVIERTQGVDLFVTARAPAVEAHDEGRGRAALVLE